MPIYEYECEECQKIIEEWQSLSDAPKTTCPCCSGPLKKLISMSSFQLKGGGWYADGYASSSKNGGACSAAAPCAAKCSSGNDSNQASACSSSKASPCVKG